MIEVGEIVVGVESQSFGRLKTTSRRTFKLSRNGARCEMWECECSCGTIGWYRKGNLLGGICRSCRCGRGDGIRNRWLIIKGVSNLTGMPTYALWKNMLSRCEKPDHQDWKYYGGKGITVCDRWKKYVNFYSDMGVRPPNKSLDRIDVNGNYEPANCRWATQKEQTNNKTNNAIVEIDGQKMTMTQCAEKYNVPFHRIRQRRRRGLTGNDLIKPAVRNVNVGDANGMAKHRRSPSIIEKTAMALCSLKYANGKYMLSEEQKSLPAVDIVKLFQWDHIVPLAIGGSNHVTNIQPLLVKDHKIKTKIDVTAIAKTKRLERQHAEFRQRLLSKTSDDPAPPVKAKSRKMPSRPFPKAEGKVQWSARKMQSRGFDKRKP